MQNTPRQPEGPAYGQHMAQAMALLRQGRLAAAAELADGLVAMYPQTLDVLMFAGDVHLRADDAQRALVLIDAALMLAPDDQDILQRKAQVLLALMRRKDAREVAGQIAALRPDDAEALRIAGAIFARCDDPRAAADHFERSLAAGNADPSVRYDIAAAQFFLGQTERAEQHLETLLSQGPHGAATYLRSTLRRQTAASNHVADLQARIATESRDPAQTAACLYGLAKELEDLERWDESFEALGKGAKLKRGTLQYDVTVECEVMEHIARAYTKSAVEASPASQAGQGMIFIVGLPRTGTTLVERMLARHPEVTSVGELPYFGGALAAAAGRLLREGRGPNMVEASLDIDFAQLGETYMAGARQACQDGNAGHLVDKMPINFLYCGLIRKALPGAKIVHLVRDPRDACYAIYKTLFQRAYFFSYDLGELATYHSAYRRLMAHWHRVMPGEILDVQYESLVSAPEDNARRLLSHCGLQWNPDVLDNAVAAGTLANTASAAQAREPVHANSVGRWRRYEHRLAPLLQGLRAGGLMLD